MFSGRPEFFLARRFRPDVNKLALKDLIARWLRRFEGSDVFSVALAFADCVLSEKALPAFFDEELLPVLAEDLRNFDEVDPRPAPNRNDTPPAVVVDAYLRKVA